MATPDGQPIVSHVCPDGTLLETIYDADAGTTALVMAAPGANHAIVAHFEASDGSHLIPYSPRNNLLQSGCVLLPSGVEDIGDVGDLVRDIRCYLARYVDLSPDFLTLVPYYVLLSWVYDAFKEVPYARFVGAWGSGKTRGLLALGSICYKPFFASGASTVSPIFHILDTFRGTLILDEADLRFSDTTNELVKILNNGTVDGLPVLRTMTNRHRELNPTAFRVFGPKILAMRESFSDEALESRFLTETMARRPLSDHIPIHTPATLGAEARVLRNRLLGFRLAYRWKVAPDPALAIAGAEARTNQMALPLLSLIADADERARVVRWIARGDDARHDQRLQSPDMLVLSATLDAFEQSSTPYVAVADITARFNARASRLGHRAMSNKWVGAALRQTFGLSTTKYRGTYGVSAQELPRVRELASRANLPTAIPISFPT